MRRICYAVAMSLDGFIAGPKGEFDWILTDPEIDFAKIWERYDTFLMGRRTYEVAIAGMGRSAFRGKEVIVASRTMRPAEHPEATIVPHLELEKIRELRARHGKDIWLFGGGEIFSVLLEMGEVDRVEVTVEPVLLGGGVPLLQATSQRTKLRLVEHQVFGSGIVSLAYEVEK